MRSIHVILATWLAFLIFPAGHHGQVEGIRESAGMPSSRERMVYGRVSLGGLEPGSKPPMVTVTLLSQRLQMTRTTLDKEGYYYFRELTVNGGTIVVEVDGSEVARQAMLTVGPLQQRMDFYVSVPSSKTLAKPGTLDAKYAYDRNKENRELMDKAVQLIEKGKSEKAIQFLSKIVASDPDDYAALTILGAAYSAISEPAKAEVAFLAALNAKPDSVPTMISLGKHYLSEKKFEKAIEILEKATRSEPSAAMGFRLLGEAYLYAKKGSKGIPALEEALRLDPVEMAECHLLLARLYNVVGAKHLASLEYKMFLEKVPDHPDKGKMRAYIKENPIQ